MLWVRGWWVPDWVNCSVLREGNPDAVITDWTFDAGGGNLLLSCTRRTQPPLFARASRSDDVEWGWTHHAMRSWGADPPSGFLFRWETDHYTGTRYRHVGFPLWFPLASFAVLPAARLLTRVRRHPPG